MTMRSLAPLVCAFTLSAALAGTQDDAPVMRHPKGYVACRAAAPLTIDGRLDEPSWQSAPWTENFVDIEGDIRPIPRYRTRAKMLWDDTYLYIGAEVDDPHVWATLTKRDTVIFYDNDFEVFIDPNGDSHEYYEFEMNALNTVWDLFLPKPYKDSGSAVDSWNIDGLKTAVHVRGTINNPADTDSGWTAEIAMPWTALGRYAHRPAPPHDGDQWRINFSRVEWLTDIVQGKYMKVPGRREDNWVWSPQWVVDMHRPERWGYLQFSAQPPGTVSFVPDPAWSVRCLLHEVYYAQRAFRDSAHHWAGSLDELHVGPDVRDAVREGLVLEPDARGYTVSMPLKLPGGTTQIWKIRQDALIQCFPAPASGAVPGKSVFSIIPRPRECKARQGAFLITRGTQISVTGKDSVPFPVEYLAAQLRLVTGFPIPVVAAKNSSSRNTILFDYAGDNEKEGEGYALAVTPERVRVRASEDAGAFNAVQTILQLLPPESFGGKKAPGVRWSIPSGDIADAPRFPWRGVHLDVSRHFFPPSFIYRLIDILALHKLNVFHWHLTDDQGWRIEIRKYPRLTSVGAWRADREAVDWGLREPQHPGEQATYGGFYTQDEIRAIVCYAAERNVTIVPEIEMPAHTTAALAAYPQFSCKGVPLTVTTGALWPITDIFCAGNDSTFIFLEDILTEVFDLFPGTYVHIGGDEADKTNWKTCPKCQARMKKENLPDENALQSWFMAQIAEFARSRGKRVIGWDEILDGGLAPGAAVMSWRGTEGGLRAARLGHDVVMTPGSNTYLSSLQGRPEYEPAGGGGYLPLRKVYAFEPVPDSLTCDETGRILGGEACLWSEFVADSTRAEYMYLPRLSAIAEVLWSPAPERSPEDFFGRIGLQLKRYGAAHLAYAKSLYLVSMSTVLDTARRRVMVSLESESGDTPIRYTLDGSAPTAVSPLYRGPFAVGRSVEIRAASARGGRLLGPATSHRIMVHNAIACPVALRYPCGKYTGGGPFALTDGVEGTRSYDDG
ncbi:MAG TPA: family 20 glycosylhydrolase, partial [Bacteroidota bacterium]|nr:family 20 glycosylhydrolase [Bacteroidota bacterium]